VIEAFYPTVDGGRFPVKRVVGEIIGVGGDIFADGHDEVRAVLRSRKKGSSQWHERPLVALGNDAWRTDVHLHEMGPHEFQIVAWVDPFQTWLRDFKKRIAVGQDVKVDLLIGAQILTAAAKQANKHDVLLLTAWQNHFTKDQEAGKKLDASSLDELAELAGRYPDRTHTTESPVFGVIVERIRSQFSSWYECFPRSTASMPGQHGSFKDLIARLPYIADLGFDVVYLPPIHPIGTTFRKGPNNTLIAGPSDPGVPWAIGSPDGGHKAIHKQLGTLADFHELLRGAEKLGMEIALDIAFQCSPDHPYVKEHPAWFRHRPDGSIQYAENPPKKYQDIYPFDFESSDWQGLWRELTDVMRYWCKQGVRVFRVDNPHTKSLPFWESAIGELKQEFPELILLSEAFTRPKVMYRLAKAGFTQSYTYFTWRYGRDEFKEYLTELNSSPVADFFRPNFWPNTPDILPEHLQTGGRAAFVGRVVLAATLSSNYGIYGPAYELLEHVPREPGSEEYLNSEKYEIKCWDLNSPQSIAPVIRQLNRIRKAFPALQSNAGLVFHATDNDCLLCYSKGRIDDGTAVIVVVNLDWRREHHGYVTLDLEKLGFSPAGEYRVRDLLSEQVFTWSGGRNFVELDPQQSPAHVLRLES
jgi:starch synthase (maltosyl-transferring)